MGFLFLKCCQIPGGLNHHRNSLSEETLRRVTSRVREQGDFVRLLLRTAAQKEACGDGMNQGRSCPRLPCREYPMEFRRCSRVHRVQSNIVNTGVATRRLVLHRGPAEKT